MGKLRELSRELGAEIIYFYEDEFDLPLEDDIKGFFFPESNIIYIREDLTIHEQENVILHEIGHCHYGHIHYACHSAQYSSKQEAEANYFMIKFQFQQWILSWNFAPEPEELNLNQFKEAYNFGHYLNHLCEKVFEEYADEYFVSA